MYADSYSDIQEVELIAGKKVQNSNIITVN